ncbi:GNAT family N-acetyltransferase [Streptomyces sp. L7]
MGIHLLLAPAGPDGTRTGWSAALMDVLAAYVLLGPDRRRIVVDPDVRNEKAIARFLRRELRGRARRWCCRRSTSRTCSCPEKHAQLAFLLARWPSRSLPE